MILRIKLVEPLYNELRMPLVLRKNNRLAQHVAAVYPNSLFHDLLQHVIYRLYIIYRLIQQCFGNKIGHYSVIFYEIVFKPFLIFRR